MVKIEGNRIVLDTPAQDIRLFVRGHAVLVTGITVDKLNRVYVTAQVVENERT